MALDVLKEYLREYVGTIVLATGVLLVIIGILFINIFGSIVSVFALFLGIIFAAFGFFARIGLFYNLRSINGLGTVLVCISVVCFALAISLMAFLQVKGIRLLPQYYRGVFEGYMTLITVYRPYAWISLISVLASFATFVAGLIVKVYCYFR
jgi:hypothetical protein